MHCKVESPSYLSIKDLSISLCKIYFCYIICWCMHDLRVIMWLVLIIKERSYSIIHLYVSSFKGDNLIYSAFIRYRLPKLLKKSDKWTSTLNLNFLNKASVLLIFISELRYLWMMSSLSWLPLQKYVCNLVFFYGCNLSL